MSHDVDDPEQPKTEDARDLQARLYREIGISAVAAALRFIAQPDPGQAVPVARDVPAVLRDEPKAA